MSAMRTFSGRDAPADVVLLDVRLPVAQDLRVLHAMHVLSPATPVIVMTAYGSRELAEQAGHLGAFEVIDKPFEMSALPPLVGRALSLRAS